jgi:hypothetical protein
MILLKRILEFVASTGSLPNLLSFRLKRGISTSSTLRAGSEASTTRQNRSGLHSWRFAQRDTGSTQVGVYLTNDLLIQHERAGAPRRTLSAIAQRPDIDLQFGNSAAQSVAVHA